MGRFPGCGIPELSQKWDIGSKSGTSYVPFPGHCLKIEHFLFQTWDIVLKIEHLTFHFRNIVLKIEHFTFYFWNIVLKIEHFTFYFWNIFLNSYFSLRQSTPDFSPLISSWRQKRKWIYLLIIFTHLPTEIAETIISRICKYCTGWNSFFKNKICIKIKIMFKRNVHVPKVIWLKYKLRT